MLRITDEVEVLKKNKKTHFLNRMKTYKAVIRLIIYNYTE